MAYVVELIKPRTVGVREYDSPEPGPGDVRVLVAKSGFREYFHLRTGRGYGTRSFSWSAALLIHTLMGSE